MTRDARAGCWCSEAARSASRWRRRCARMGGRGRRGRGNGAPPSPRARAAGRGARRGALRARASSSASASTRRRRRLEDGEFVLEFPERERAPRRPPAGRHRPAAADRWPGPRDRRHRAGHGPASRSTPACASAENLWAIGDVTGVWPLTYVGQVPGPDRRRQHPRRAARGRLQRRPRVVSPTRRRPRSEMRRHAHGHRRRSRTSPAPRPTRAPTTTKPGFMTLVSDGERITGAYALGPEAGEWLQQATVAIRAGVPLAVMQRRDPAVPDLLRGLPPRAYSSCGVEAPVPA